MAALSSWNLIAFRGSWQPDLLQHLFLPKYHVLKLSSLYTSNSLLQLSRFLRLASRPQSNHPYYTGHLPSSIYHSAVLSLVGDYLPNASLYPETISSMRVGRGFIFFTALSPFVHPLDKCLLRAHYVCDSH